VALFMKLARQAVKEGADVIIPMEGILAQVLASQGIREIDGAVIMVAHSRAGDERRQWRASVRRRQHPTSNAYAKIVSPWPLPLYSYAPRSGAERMTRG